MLEFINDKNINFGIVIRSNYKSKDIEFFTAKESNFQVGGMTRGKNYEVKAHVHSKSKRIIETTSEVLFIKNGKISIDFYNEKNNKISQKIINKGDIVVLLHGGHGIKFLEKSEIIEIKQGPYNDFADKSYI